MNEVMTGLFLVLVKALTLSIGLMVPVLLKYLMDWIKAKRLEADASADIDRIEARQQRLVDAATLAVKSVNTVYVDDLKAAAADGKLTEEERKEARAKAITAAKKHLLLEGLDVASSILEDYIEEAVSRVKK